MPASKAQERRISPPTLAVLEKTATQAQDGYSQPVEVVSGMTATKAQDEQISQPIRAVLEKTAFKAQDIDVGTALPFRMPVRTQELLSWIKKLRISGSAHSFSPAHTALHAPASVNIQALLTWIPRMRLC